MFSRAFSSSFRKYHPKLPREKNKFVTYRGKTYNKWGLPVLVPTNNKSPVFYSGDSWTMNVDKNKKTLTFNGHIFNHDFYMKNCKDLIDLNLIYDNNRQLIHYYRNYDSNNINNKIRRIVELLKSQ
jgi:hypothetical protein